MIKPSKKVDVWMPLYVGDYLRDTTHLSTEQHGAYLLLILNYWNRGKALPDEDSYLARVSGLTGEGWNTHKRTLMNFFDVREGAWFHNRVELELTKAIKQAEDKSKAGKKGAEIRYGRATSSAIAAPLADASQGHGTTKAEPLAERSQTDAPSPSSSSSSSSLPLHSQSQPPTQGEITIDTRGSDEPQRGPGEPCSYREASDYGTTKGIPPAVIKAWFFVSSKNNWKTVAGRTGARMPVKHWKGALEKFAKTYPIPPTCDARLMRELVDHSDNRGFQFFEEWIELNDSNGWIIENADSGIWEPIYNYKACLDGFIEKTEADKRSLNPN